MEYIVWDRQRELFFKGKHSTKRLGKVYLNQIDRGTKQERLLDNFASSCHCPKDIIRGYLRIITSPDK